MYNSLNQSNMKHYDMEAWEPKRENYREREIDYIGETISTWLSSKNIQWARTPNYSWETHFQNDSIVWRLLKKEDPLDESLIPFINEGEIIQIVRDILSANQWEKVATLSDIDGPITDFWENSEGDSLYVQMGIFIPALWINYTRTFEH